MGLNTGNGVGIGDSSTKNILYQEGDVDQLPQKISGSDPEIPTIFANSKLEGVVEVLIVIDQDGKVIKVTSLKEDPMGYGLKNSVIQTIWNWRFKPATLKNIPVKIQVIIPFIF